MFFPKKQPDYEFGCTRVVKGFAFYPFEVCGAGELVKGRVWLESYDKVQMYYGSRFTGWSVEFRTLAGEGKQLAIQLARRWGGTLIQ
jgi:hypothetical protein